MKKIILLGAILALLGVSPTRAESNADPRVKKILDEIGVGYEINDDGDYKLILEMENGRSQLCYINSSVEEYKTMQIREVWSPAYKSSCPFSAAVANQLLEDSYQKKLGAWGVWKSASTNSYIAVFAAKLPADCDGPTLASAILGVVTAADNMEQQLTGKDDY